MISSTRPDRIRYTAEIANVREVTLHGTADLGFWHKLLQPHGLLPDSTDGAAHLVISATALVWKRLSFRELIVTIATCTDRDQPQPDSFYLAHAFNSSRLLAWTERRLFNTPYTHADIQLNTSAPLIDVQRGNQPLLSAQMAESKAPSTQRSEDWNGPVFLPGRARKYFVVALSGEQAIYPFATADRLEIVSGADQPVFQQLKESHFTPTEWRICTSANHKRSQTYRRECAAQP